MNKLKVTIAGLLVACLGMGVVNAQTPSATPVSKQAPAKKSTTKAKPAAETTKTATPATTAKPAQHLKKDGTPDMRYKENKAAAGKTGTKAAPKKAAATTGTSGK